MSDFTEKVRAMLEYFPNLPLRSDTRSWKCFDSEGVLLFQFNPWDESGCRFEDLAMFSLFSSAPTLLREACEREEKFDRVVEAAKEWEKCNKNGSKIIDIFAVVKAADNLRGAIAALDAKEQS